MRPAGTASPAEPAEGWTLQPAKPGLGRQRLVREVDVLWTLIERLHAQIARQDQLAGVGRIVSGTVNELNSPLSGLAVTLELMRETMAAADPGAPASALMKDLGALVVAGESAVERVQRLVSSLQGLGQDGGKNDLIFDPGRAIQDAVELFAFSRRRECQVELELGPLPSLQGSPAQLGQVILHLLQNGLEASGPEPRLEVRAGPSERGVRISVADHGSGIAPELASKIFEPFCATRVGGGGELGLYICRGLVISMGGSIAFETGPGGTTFNVELPVHGSASGEEGGRV